MASKKAAPKFVVIRSYAAGVHCGELISKRDNGGRMVVVLKSSRRLWRWRGANSLNEVAMAGVAEDYTRLSELTAEVEVSDVLEIHVASAKAKENLERSRWAA
jgi:hypothetical protein